jgi:hypothetical protein
MAGWACDYVVGYKECIQSSVREKLLKKAKELIRG